MTNGEMNDRLATECRIIGFTLIDWSAVEETIAVHGSTSTVTRKVVRVNVKSDTDGATEVPGRFLMRALEFPWTLSLTVVK